MYNGYSLNKVFEFYKNMGVGISAEKCKELNNKFNKLIKSNTPKE